MSKRTTALVVGASLVLSGVTHYYDKELGIGKPPQQVTISRVDVVEEAVSGQTMTLRIWGTPRPGCVFQVGRDFARWEVSADGKYRYTNRQLIAAVPIAPFDPPVPDELKALPVAPYFYVTLPMPNYLKPWPDSYFQTASSPSSCPPVGKSVPESQRVVEFNAKTSIKPGDEK